MISVQPATTHARSAIMCRVMDGMLSDSLPQTITLEQNPEWNWVKTDTTQSSRALGRLGDVDWARVSDHWRPRPSLVLPVDQETVTA